MIKIRKASERGHINHGWLDTYHSFSFGSYHDPAHMGFSDLRVINDDVIAANKGFGTHPHENMEIITFILDGQLEHKDSMGNGSVINAYDVQRMSAGTGITHSEFNPSESQECNLLQVWILPKELEIEPSYEQKHFPKESRQGLRLLVSNDGRDGSVSINQDANIFGAWLNGNLEHKLSKPSAYIHVHGGELEIDGHLLTNGDAAEISDEAALELKGKDAEFLLFELE